MKNKKIIKIENIFKTSRVFAHANYRDILDKALEQNLITESDLSAIYNYSRLIFESKRISEKLVDRVCNLTDKLDKTFPDFSQIKFKIQRKLAEEFEMKNYLDLAIANLEISEETIKCQFLLDKENNWRDCTVVI